MPTDPLTAARYPASTNVPNVPQDIQNAVNDLSDLIGGKFTTTAARDTAFSTWVAQGNTMTDGLMCRVAGRQQVYRSGSWHGVGVIALNSTAGDYSATYTTARDIISVSVPDPGYPYVIQATGSVLMNVGSGSTVAGQISVGGTLINPRGPNVSTGSNVLVSTWGLATSGSITGATTVTLSIQIIVLGSVGYAALPGIYNQLSVQVVPT